jgi:hypothetical protein
MHAFSVLLLMMLLLLLLFVCLFVCLCVCVFVASRVTEPLTAVEIAQQRHERAMEREQRIQTARNRAEQLAYELEERQLKDIALRARRFQQFLDRDNPEAIAPEEEKMHQQVLPPNIMAIRTWVIICKALVHFQHWETARHNLLLLKFAFKKWFRSAVKIQRWWRSVVLRLKQARIRVRHVVCGVIFVHGLNT